MIHPGWNPMLDTPKIGLTMQWACLSTTSITHPGWNPMLDTPKISLTIQWDVVKLWWLSDKTNFGSAQHGIDWIGKQGSSGIHPGWNPMQVTPKIGLIMQWVALKRRSLCDKKLFTVKSNIQHRILSWIYPGWNPILNTNKIGLTI